MWEVVQWIVTIAWCIAALLCIIGSGAGLILAVSYLWKAARHA